jgi:hypothetical protein
MNVQVREFAATSTVQHVLHRDYETRGVLQLQKVGPWKYAADDRTEVLCCAYAIDDEPVRLWLPGHPAPPEFVEAAQDPAWLVCAHNAQFEIAIEHLIMRRRHGWPKIPLRQQQCTMAAALALALPPKLELIAEALELVHQKDKAGQRLMLMHVIRCGQLLLKCTGMFLFIKLPSGRKLAYPFPRIEIEDLEHEVVVFKDASSGQWRDCRGGNGAYGGLWTENIV